MNGERLLEFVEGRECDESVGPMRQKQLDLDLVRRGLGGMQLRIGGTFVLKLDWHCLLQSHLKRDIDSANT